MDRVESQFEQFCARFREDGSTDPLEFLDGLAGPERAELTALIDQFLLEGPRREWNRDEFERSPAKDMAGQLTAQLVADQAAAAEDLVALRNRAKVSRESLVAGLAERLEVPGATVTVADYYHRMEHGRLDLARVSSRVFEAIADLTGVAVESAEASAARAAGRGTGGPATSFARTVTGSGDGVGEASAKSGNERKSAEALIDDAPIAPGPEAERRRADRLFTGG